MDKNKSIILATGYDEIDFAIKDYILDDTEYDFVGQAKTRSSLIDMVSSQNPDCIMISKTLAGQDIGFIDTISKVKQINPKIRVIHLAGDVSHSESSMIELGTLVILGVYDIIEEQSLNEFILKDAIVTHKQEKDVAHFAKFYKKNTVLSQNEVLNFQEQKKVVDVQQNGIENVYMISSIKPGTGKSFVSVNLSLMIAKFGKLKNGKPVRVALIEGDCQNLSVGTLLNYPDNDKFNLKTVLDEIKTLFISEKEITKDEIKINRVNEFILKSFIPYSKCKNLFALVGSQIQIQDLTDVNAYCYQYLIEFIASQFDVVIVDTNSSIFHFNTVPMLKLCNKAFYILNLDFNNIRNNKKYQTLLTELSVMDKVRYILNEDIDKEYRLLQNQPIFENIKYTAEHVAKDGFNLIGKIPEIPKEIFLNRLYDGVPIVLDDSDYTIKARCELAQIANPIWEIEIYNDLFKQYEKYKEKVMKHLKKKKKGLSS